MLIFAGSIKSYNNLDICLIFNCWRSI